MPFDKTTLPAPPEFPASNASYNKIVGKMHKAALCATTATAAIAAVESITAHVGGVNTYAKATRRYGDHLVAAIKGEPVAEKAPKAKAEKKAPAKAKPTEVEKAAANGDPVAGFMLKGATAQAEVDEILAASEGGGKTFSNKSNGKRALAKDQLDHLPVEWEPVGDKLRPVLIVKDGQQALYVAQRGYTAKVSA